MEDRLCFVQFIHPGGEHRPDVGGLKQWNQGSHKRKFLRGRGYYFDGDELREGEFGFWGEWEAESRVVAELGGPARDAPRFLYEPYYAPKVSYRGLQNTDPFVFGDRFHYTGCLQHTKRGPTQLRNLARGSVVLFGSCLKSRFVLDTVFVVDGYIDHSRRDFPERLDGRISRTYQEVTINPWYASLDDDRDYRLYSGATHEEPVGGMFSFVPCLPMEREPQGFARPTLRIPGVVNGRLRQGKRLNPKRDLAEVKTLWETVAGQVLNQDLALGVRMQLPRRVGDIRGPRRKEPMFWGET